MTIEWFLISLSLIASAFFSGMEIAFLTSNKLKIELENKQGSINSKIYSYFLKKQSYFLATMLLGNCIALVVFSVFMAVKLEPVLSGFIHNHVALGITQTILSTLFIVVTAEFLPKNLFRINPNGTLKIFAFPVFIIYVALYPLTFFSITLSNFILRTVLRVKFEENESGLIFGKIDLDHLVRESTTHSKNKADLEHEVAIFQNALDFSELKARECMIPRTEIIGIEVNESIEYLKNKFVETKLSKMIIYENNMDNIIGYVHSYELFNTPSSIRSVLLPVLIVPESKPASEVLTLFIQQHKSVALVVDEFGGTSGMLTMEDIMEEIFGEIEDEHDKEELVEKKISSTEYLFSARLEIDYINQKYNLNIPITDEFETLAGFVLTNFESIPNKGDVMKVGNFTIRVTQVSDNKIEQIHLRLE